MRPELLLFEGARERFRREIDAVARLEHPAIVPILATGSADGVPYYAMPRLRGKNGEALVRALLRRDPNELTGRDLRAALDAAPEQAPEPTTDVDGVFEDGYWRAVVRLVRKAALGIGHAHARGVLHRDLKPSNIVFTPAGEAIVLDFGLAQARGDARLTRTGAAAGSPAYMAPELLRGEPADERTDVYGLAATLHCLLALRPPFGLDAGDALRAHILAGDRERLRDLVHVPPELSIVVDAAMDLDRTRRHASAEAFADDLLAVLDGRAITARRLPLRVRGRRWLQRHRALTAALTVAAVFLAVVPVLLLWQQRSANAALVAANDRMREINAELQAQGKRSGGGGETSTEAADGLLANVGQEKLRNVPATLTVAVQVLEEALKLFDRLADDERHRDQVQIRRLNAMRRLIELQNALGDFDAARGTAERALELLATLFASEASMTPERRMVRAELQRAIAAVDVMQQRTDRAAEFVDAARADYTACLGRVEPAGEPLRGLSLVESMDAGLAVLRRDAAAAEQGFLRSIDYAAQARAAGASDQLYDIARGNLHKLYCRLRRYDDAIALADAVISSHDAVEGAEYGWPVPRMVLAIAVNVRLRSLLNGGRVAEADPTFTSLVTTLDDLLQDYPEAADARRLRASARANYARPCACCPRATPTTPSPRSS